MGDICGGSSSVSMAKEVRYIYIINMYRNCIYLEYLCFTKQL